METRFEMPDGREAWRHTCDMIDGIDDRKLQHLLLWPDEPLWLIFDGEYGHPILFCPYCGDRLPKRETLVRTTDAVPEVT